MVERLNRQEGFYSGELLAWHAYERTRQGLSVSGSVELDNSYAFQLEGLGETDGTYNIIDTRQYLPGSRLIRRLDPQRFLASTTSGENCGRVGFSGGKKTYRMCLGESKVKAGKPILFLSYLFIGSSSGRNAGLELMRILDNGKQDMDFGVVGIVNLQKFTSARSLGPSQTNFPFFLRADHKFLFVFKDDLALINQEGVPDLSFGTDGHIHFQQPRLPGLSVS